MIRATMLDLILIAGAVLAGCERVQGDETSGQSTETCAVTSVVTADIQAGIERYIANQTDHGDGYFELPYVGEMLRLKLFRVHTEYLATLGPRRHFACVDLVAVGAISTTSISSWPAIPVT